MGSWKKNSNVIGLTGLVWSSLDKGIVWLGWFCVDSDSRGHGVGSNLLDFSIYKAKELDFKKLLLWTSTLPYERDAQGLYESRGLMIYDKERVWKNSLREKGYTLLYRELKL